MLTRRSFFNAIAFLGFSSAATRATATPDRKGRQAAGRDVIGSPDFSRLMPIGTIIDSLHYLTPPGWLLCYGQAIDRRHFAKLFAVLGELYGPGDGRATFNLPDFREPMPVHSHGITHPGHCHATSMHVHVRPTLFISKMIFTGVL